jgi:DNA-binding PadR family transcriptional regulator
MAEKGYLDSREVKEPGQSGLPRRVFRVTGLGQRVLNAWQAAAAAWAGRVAAL